jgi:endonuclease/exonuclease/phosphatase family metal-dependent hydrolase
MTFNIMSDLLPPSPRHAISSEGYVELLESYRSKYLIGGDWNAKHSQWGARLITQAMNRQYCNYLSMNKPTYWPSDYNKLPDLLDFFIYKGITTNYIQIECNHEVSSDHTPVNATLSTHVIYKPTIPILVTTELTGTAFAHTSKTT